MTGPLVVQTVADLDDALAPFDAARGPGVGADRPRRAVVMTMGALHEGHLTLVRRARELVGPAGQVVVTDFVNPLQFGPGEDFDRYPRDLDGDVRLLTPEGVDVVFAPHLEEMYPDGDALVRVSAGQLGTILEGAARPGHFDGMLTVVLKLLHLVRPDVALFGEKDAQQLLLVRRMVRDLDVRTEIVGVPIVREPDGLARSSRNAYLTADERPRALALSAALRASAAAADAGGTPSDVVAAAAGVLNDAEGVVVDYLALVDPTTVEDLTLAGSVEPGPALVLVAARVGTTRLIDNTTVRLA
ncbi:pantoate--beta-alanine ligase [Luteimicrobium sp. NPDC057192]|uniref:pantoate--beta-alanine ligase n=1 Tax=Luteimicrobium sp. NPDC057192 TaxID=3346042 RepID=UPI003636EABF